MHEQQQQQFAPWGIVTPTFWQAGQPEQRVEAARVPQIQEVVLAKAEEAQPAPAPQPEQLVQAAQVPQAREAVPVKAEEPQPAAAPAPQAREEAARAAETVHRPDVDEQPGTQVSGAVNENQVAEAGDGAEQGGPPAEYRDRIGAIIAAFDAPTDAARLAAAAVDAEQLDQEFTARYGQQHPHTINLRELRGWLAYLQGQMGVAARWYLHTTGLQAQVWGSGHQATQGSVQRAVHIWLSIPDTQESLTIGQELLAMLAAVTGEDSGLSRKVRSRLKSMGAQDSA